MAVEFSNKGSRLFTGKVKPDWKFNFVNDKNVEQTEQELKKMRIELEIEK